ncbi:hypothetical protein KZJ38_21580 [Paraburkholderia edwinii]|uniref:Uncharacterized protein n=1 Tax=Paraburkholderia edwinii TaxID=2861782 RepID=A0ABX8UIC9_9BURK|nr:hypothetical protein [Paraburkholderia edwinii]QYD68775.1 hypothetical protein KZJ38_21580 [Paraburkholderia edwinii]
MTATKARIGRKPAIAFTSEQLAYSNLEIKAEIVTALLVYGATSELHHQLLHDKLHSTDKVFAPTTLRQFLRWDDASSACGLIGQSVVEIRRTGNGTLDRYADDHVKIVGLIALRRSMQSVARERIS